MTYNEFGLQLRKLFPKLAEVPLNNEDLAQYFLNLYPQYYDSISPTARRIKEISERIPTSQRWTEKGRVESEGKMIDNNRAEAASLHEMDMLIKASALGIPVTALHDIAVQEHQTAERIKYDQFVIDSGLYAADTAQLSLHQQIERLQRRLMALIDERDTEFHPDKREVLDARIQHLKQELYARQRQAVVQAGGGEGMGSDDQDTNGVGGLGASDEADVESQTAKKSRVGF